jgi:trans-aconitate methyltransferase
MLSPTMSDPVHALYQSHAYPAMSHPSTDPAVTAVAAKLAGLDVPAPSCANVLDIGCASGYNLLPLAARWPESHFTGIDFSKSAILEARETARLAGLTNIEFIECDLRNFDPGENCYDYIIAHGIYSWVPAEVRQSLLDFCKTHLSPEGVATICYNTLPGWALRNTLVDLTSLIAQSPAAETIGRDPEQILAFLATAAGNHTPYAKHLNTVLHDMFSKGAEVLSFDDFGPINEACTFLEFASHAGRSGLQYLGEASLQENFPISLPLGAEETLQPLATDPLALQQVIDVLTNRTFRNSLVCRADAPIQTRITTAAALHFSVRCEHLLKGTRLIDRSGIELANFEHPLTLAFFSALAETSPQSVPMQEILEIMAGRMKDPFDPTHSLPLIARMVMDSARQNLIKLRDLPVRFDPSPPTFPNLGALNRIAAKNAWPLVDIYHAPLTFSNARQQIACKMDGTHSIAELAALAKVTMPEFNFHAWLTHLAALGMFAR